MSEVRGRSREDPMPKGRQPRGVTPHPRSGAVAGKSYPMSKVRDRSQEDPMPKGQWPRGVTLCPRSGAAAKSARLQQRRNGREELPSPRSGAAARRSYFTSEARGGG